MKDKRVPVSAGLRTTAEAEEGSLNKEWFDQNPGTWESKMENFPKYVRRQNLTRFLVLYEIFKKVLDVKGSIVECGINQGYGIMSWAKFSAIMEPVNLTRRIYGFDTFEGFTAIDAENDPKDISSDNLSDTSFETIQKSQDALDIVRPVNKIKRFELVKGDITCTVPSYIDNNPAFTCSMLILDTDLYRPTLTALECIMPHMPKGGLVVLDEYNYQNFSGETKALKDFDSLGNFELKRFRHDSCLAYFVI